MTNITRLDWTDSLPLTCARTGTCCHGKRVRVNPYELARLAEAKGVSSRDFRDAFCEGGIVLKFTGAPGWKDMAACSQYVPGMGCAVHTGRPLACRLFPLGRLRQGQDLYYMFQGNAFPCLEGCPEVKSLPSLTVADYVAGQGAAPFEAVHDAYLELMQDVADGAFSYLLDTGLSAAQRRSVIQRWSKLGSLGASDAALSLPMDWFDALTLPEWQRDLSDGLACVAEPRQKLQQFLSDYGMDLERPEQFQEAAEWLMALALLLARALGMDAESLASRWVAAAGQSN